MVAWAGDHTLARFLFHAFILLATTQLGDAGRGHSSTGSSFAMLAAIQFYVSLTQHISGSSLGGPALVLEHTIFYEVYLALSALSEFEGSLVSINAMAIRNKN